VKDKFQVGDLVQFKQISMIPDLHGHRVGMVTDFDKKSGYRTKKYLIYWTPANKSAWHYSSELSILSRKEGNV